MEDANGEFQLLNITYDPGVSRLGPSGPTVRLKEISCRVHALVKSTAYGLVSFTALPRKQLPRLHWYSQAQHLWKSAPLLRSLQASRLRLLLSAVTLTRSSATFCLKP